jgi:sugar phosphate isomerase/epimerase
MELCMHDRLSVHSICFREADLRTLARHWSDLGIRRVSLYSGLIEKEGIAAAQAALRSGQYEVETITHTFLPLGHQLDAKNLHWNTPQENLNRVIADAKTLGARSIELFTGGQGALTWEDAAECFGNAVAPCLERAKTAGVSVMAENTPSRYAGMHLAGSLRDTVTLAELTGIDICIDVFSCWSEAGLKQTIERAAPRTLLVQIGDYLFDETMSPGRAVPGDGMIPLDRILDWILRAGYRGTFEIELLGPRIDKEGHLQATRRAVAYIAETLRSLGA